MATTVRSSATVAALGATLAAVGLSALGLRCAGSGPSAGADAPSAESGATDAPGDSRGETAVADSGGDVDGTEAMSCDASDASSWAGWKRIATPDACCDLEVPESLSAVLRPLTWSPCADAPACSELDPGVLGSSTPTLLFIAKSSRGSDGTPMWLDFASVVDSTKRIDQFAIYDFATSLPAAVWRTTDKASCGVGAFLGSRKVALLATTYPGLDKWLAVGPPATLAVAPVFESVSRGEVPEIQDLALSDTTFAFDLPLAGRILRTAIGSGTYVLSPATGFPKFLADFAENDDVFALSEHGSKGYGEEWRIDPDGTPVVVRAKAGRHVTTFATDGTTLFWVEGYGTTDVTATMSREVWAAPYSTDAATLEATAKKVASLPDGRLPVTAVAYGGIYAVISSYHDSIAYVVRLSDGATTSVTNSISSFGIGDLVYVSSSELWATFGRPGGNVLRRYSLGAW